MVCFSLFYCPGPPGANATGGGGGGGIHYIRWGRTTCPNTEGTVIFYSGFAAGSNGDQRGGAADYVCMTDTPEFLALNPGQQSSGSQLYPAEYQIPSGPVFSLMWEHNVPCVGCYTPSRSEKAMIPGTTSCPSGWTEEYEGYLMAEHGAGHRTTYTCVDSQAESIAGTEGNLAPSARFYFTEVYCSGVDCPLYPTGNEVTCVICTI